MPIYVYRCQRCGEEVERYQKAGLPAEASAQAGDPAPQVCDRCGGRMRKVFFPVGVIYKGSGFYTTDYARASRPRQDKPEKEDAIPGEKKQEKMKSLAEEQ